MDLSEILPQAVAALRQGNLEAAEAGLRAILQANPEQPDALHFYGILAFQAGNPELAVTMIRRSLEIRPGQAAALNNLGNVLRHLDRGRDAIDAYFDALLADPDNGEAWCNVGVLLLKTGNVPQAIAALTRAVEVNPESAESWHNLGLCHSAMGDSEQAANAFQSCADCADGLNWYDACWHGYVLGNLGRIEHALTILQGAAKRAPENEVVRHMLASMRGDELERASDGFVQRHFDRFSETFDTVLTALGYKAPEAVAARVEALRGDGPAFRDAADLGCGTGRCGALVRAHCTRLSGIDLSPGMLAQAARREVYDDLHEAEIIGYLAGAAGAGYDLALCVDTLIYFGDLKPVFAGLAGAMAPGGRCVATVERHEDSGPGHRVNPTGRFSHSQRYLRETAAACGLDLGDVEDIDLRRESRKPVAGYLFTLTRP